MLLEQFGHCSRDVLGTSESLATISRLHAQQLKKVFPVGTVLDAVQFGQSTVSGRELPGGGEGGALLLPAALDPPASLAPPIPPPPPPPLPPPSPPSLTRRPRSADVAEDGPLMIELRRRAIVENGSLVVSPASLDIDAALEARDRRRRRSAREEEDVGEEDPCGDVSRRDAESARSLSPAEGFFLAAAESAAAPPPAPKMSSKEPDAGWAPLPGEEGEGEVVVVLFASLKTSSKGLNEAMVSGADEIFKDPHAKATPLRNEKCVKIRGIILV
jgi:hypothetical protein